MTVAPVLSWSTLWDFAGRPRREVGLDGGFGIVVLAAGVATLVVVAFVRLLPLAILTGLAGGAAAGLYLLDVLSFPNVADSSTEASFGLVMALGSAALSGAAGTVALAVAAAVKARDDADPQRSSSSARQNPDT